MRKIFLFVLLMFFLGGCGISKNDLSKHIGQRVCIRFQDRYASTSAVILEVGGTDVLLSVWDGHTQTFYERVVPLDFIMSVYRVTN